MTQRSPLTRLAVAASALALPLGAIAFAAPANASDATVSVLHAIPAGAGADVVDVYAGDHQTSQSWSLIHREPPVQRENWEVPGWQGTGTPSLMNWSMNASNC